MVFNVKKSIVKIGTFYRRASVIDPLKRYQGGRRSQSQDEIGEDEKSHKRKTKWRWLILKKIRISGGFHQEPIEFQCTGYFPMELG